jgi:hypothetical protein
MRDHHAGESLAQFTEQILVEIEADREVLVGVIERTGHTPGAMKELGARLAEKVSRLKLKPGSAEGLGPVSCQRNSRTRPAFQNLERPSV